MTDDNKTIQDFGSEWTLFTENEGYYASVEMLADYLGPLMSLDEIAGLKVIDIGSGTGRIVNMLLGAGAAHVYAVEPSAAMDVCRRNTARHADQVTYLLCKGDEIPDVDADFAISLGVLHHIPEPASTVQRVFEVLPPGGRFLIWLYGEEGNWLYLKVFNPVRRLFARLPDAVLIPFAHVLAVFLRLYRYLCKFLPLPLHRYMRGVLAQFSHKQLVLTIFDQLNPTFAKYYRRDEAIDLLTTAGFIKVRTYHRHNYSWTLIGEKPRS